MNTQNKITKGNFSISISQKGKIKKRKLGNKDTAMVTVGEERTGVVRESSIGGRGIYRYRDWAGITQFEIGKERNGYESARMSEVEGARRVVTNRWKNFDV